MRKESNKNDDPASAAVALQSADAFRSLALPFLDLMGTDIDVPPNRVMENLGGLSASATLLSLSVELYLKALRLLEGQDPLYTHDLSLLFEGLSESTRASVVKVYDSIPIPPTGTPASFILELSLGEFDDPQPCPSKILADNSLISVLKRSKDAFQTWRYLYEKGKRGRTITFIYEYRNLDRAAEAVRQHVAPAVQVSFAKNSGGTSPLPQVSSGFIQFPHEFYNSFSLFMT